MGGPISSSSSGEEDGPAEWREAVESIAATTTFGVSNGFVSGSTSNATTTAKPTTYSTSCTEYDSDEDQQREKLKHYHMKAQKLLDDILEKRLEMVRDSVHIRDNGHVINEGIVRLFKHSPPGIIFDHIDELKGPTKKPRILPGKEINMKSKKFKQQIQSAVVDGVDILAAARDACQKSLAKQEAKDAAAKAKAKKEEERVTELKRIRGERWLPCMAQEMQLKKCSAIGIDKFMKAI